MRLRAVLAELTSFVGSKGNAKQKRMSFILKRVAQDVCEEMGEANPEMVSAYFDQMGKVVSWIGTGDNDSLPDSLRELFLPRTEGIQMAIEARTPEVEDVVTAPVGINT
jgi:hypothetical protein